MPRGTQIGMRRLAVAVALLALGACKGGGSDRPPDQQPAESRPEPERFAESTLSHTLRGSQLDIIQYLDTCLGASWSDVDAERCTIVDAGSGNVRLDCETAARVTPGRAKNLLQALEEGQAMILGKTVSGADSEHGARYPTGPQTSGDVNYFEVAHISQGTWALGHYLRKLRPAWLDWKARHYLQRCSAYCKPWLDEWKTQGPPDCPRVVTHCRVLGGSLH